MPPSSRGLGHLPFTEVTGIRIPLGVNNSNAKEEASKTLYKDKVLDASLFLKSINTL
jgi:hypothetical protein